MKKLKVAILVGALAVLAGLFFPEVILEIVKALADLYTRATTGGNE